jgi:HEPN domain-containing protein
MKTESILKHYSSHIHPVVAKLALHSGRIYATACHSEQSEESASSLTFTAEFTEPPILHTYGTIHLYLSKRGQKQ